MVCSVCHREPVHCESGACGCVLQNRLYCFGGVHFCSRSCWKVWFLSGEEERLILAKGMEQEGGVRPIEVKEGTPKSRITVVYDPECANCGVQPELADKIIAGGCLEEGEWVCSDKCYNGYEVCQRRAQEGIRE